MLKPMAKPSILSIKLKAFVIATIQKIVNEILVDGSDNQIEEAKYWKALCKWKKGNLQTSMNELNFLLSNSNSVKYPLFMKRIW